MRFSRSIAWLGLGLLLNGCASTLWTDYDRALRPVLARAEQGDAAAAARALERAPTSARDRLFWLEKGELLREAGDFDGSVGAWLEAERQFSRDADGPSLDDWLQRSLQYVTNDKARAYAGHDFERVLMRSRLAMDYLAQNRWDLARIEVRRSHELEALIAERQAAQAQAVAEKSGEKHAPDLSEIGGYPVATLTSPEVLALKNGYQSAFSHYLAGFVYEALGETGLAAAGYRKAIELQPDREVLRQGLAGLDKRSARSEPGIDTLIVIEQGWAPARRAQNVTLPVNYIDGHGYWRSRLVSFSFPVLQDEPGTAPSGWMLAGRPLTPELVTDTGLLARRALHDEMPLIVLRSVTRAVSRLALSQQLERQQRGDAGLGFALASALVQIGGALVEQADDRAWRSLPGRFYVARLRLPPGESRLSAPGLGELSLNLAKDRPQQLVVLRWLDHRLTRIQ